MSPLECLTALNQAGGAARVESGQLQIELPDNATCDALLDEIRKRKGELVELLQQSPMMSPAGYPPAEREILTYQVDLKLIPLVDAYAPDQTIEDFICSLWDAGCAVFAEPRSGSLVVDAPRGVLNETHWAAFAKQANDIFKAITWLGEMQHRQLYKQALKFWVGQTDLKQMQELAIGERTIPAPWVYVTGLLLKTQPSWKEITVLANELEHTSI